ncbi:MAG: nicotinate-nucleotide--dimethylbenzimidazole phosphoribosyltransferase [Coriobacteriia bacterium]|nr:nicotinate-nucleotide--dimethylbenzimidazole phosphoribosyltransferase [Coriobacteriia bacterium]
MKEETSGYEARLRRIIASVEPVDTSFEPVAYARLDQLTKPVGSLGRLEEIACRVATIQRTDHPAIDRKVVLVMCADHGVTAEDVSLFPAEVTAQMVVNVCAGGAAINQIADSVGAEVRVYDIGVAGDLAPHPRLCDCKVAAGTANMAVGPAMSREECAQAVLCGIDASRKAAQEGFSLIATGELGIGNTTAAAALTAALTRVAVSAVVGRGTGLNAEKVAHKAEVVRRALEVNGATGSGAVGLGPDPFGTLSALGGLELAALAGVVIGAAATQTTVVVDGFISGAAALAATMLCPAARGYIIPSHLSAEPGHRVVCTALKLEPIIEFEMRLGEGTGAALAMGIVDAACRMLSGMATLAEAGVSQAKE